MIVLYILALVFLALSILFFLGKGKNLISGYNTMSDKEKSKYDEKKQKLQRQLNDLESSD